MTPVRVVLCDDAAEMRALLRWTIDGPEATIVGEAEDGDAALALMSGGLVADVIVLDLQMPGPGPEELLAAMAETAPGVAIVTFSGYEPEMVAPGAASLVTRHIPKTTDLALVREAILGAGRRA